MSREFFVADMHAHPTVKTFVLPPLFRRQFYKAHRPARTLAPFGMRCDLPSLMDGGVNLLVSSVYIPEWEFLRQCWFMNLLSLLAPKFRSRVKKHPYRATLECIERFENREIYKARQKLGDVVEVAVDLENLDRILGEGKIAILHAVEGAHILNYGPPGWSDARMIADLAEQGVCMLTLAHHYDNNVAPPVMGIPRDYFSVRYLGCHRDVPDETQPLPDPPTRIRGILEAMIQNRMIVDMTHSTPPARETIRSICNEHDWPVVLSHAGVRELASFAMNPGPEEIRAVAERGGVVGVIMMDYWLTGRLEGGSVEDVLATIQKLVDAGGDDCVAIGSDYDGMTDPPDDLKEPAELPRLYDRMVQRFGPERTGKFLGLNFLRVLRRCWR